MIKYPGGEVAFWTVLWTLAGSFVSYTSFEAGKTGLSVVFAVLPLASALLWLDIRQAKWLIIAYCAFATLGGIVMLFAKGVELRIVGQLVGAVYSIALLLRWNGGPNAE
jgi:hypothetical protein